MKTLPACSISLNPLILFSKICVRRLPNHLIGSLYTNLPLRDGLAYLRILEGHTRGHSGHECVLFLCDRGRDSVYQ